MSAGLWVSVRWLIGAGEQREYFTDRSGRGRGFGQRQISADLVAVAAAVFGFHDVSGLDQIADDPVSAAFGDAEVGSDLT